MTTISIEGREHIVPLDLLVPEALSPGEGRRGARLGPHGKRAARKVRGLEAVVVDNDTMTISALDPLDPRSIDVKVAGSAALLIAKAYKIAERVASGRPIVMPTRTAPTSCDSCNQQILPKWRRR